jgi:hypothetical protein
VPVALNQRLKKMTTEYRCTEDKIKSFPPHNVSYYQAGQNGASDQTITSSYLGECPANSICDDRDLWSINYLIDVLKKRLACVTQSTTNTNASSDSDKESVDSRVYYDQAYKMLKIGALRPAPTYIILLRDLTPKIISELYRLDTNDRGYVLKQAVGRIFEDVNSDIYHNSISRVLKVQLK